MVFDILGLFADLDYPIQKRAIEETFRIIGIVFERRFILWNGEPGFLAIRLKGGKQILKHFGVACIQEIEAEAKLYKGSNHGWFTDLYASPAAPAHSPFGPFQRPLWAVFPKVNSVAKPVMLVFAIL